LKKINRIKVKAWKKSFQANESPNQAEVAIFIADKVEFKPKLV
jgi:hypothetical protein